MPVETSYTSPAAPVRGPALLLVHGMWHDAWCWEPHFVPFFAEAGYPVHALSLPGHGACPAPRPLWRVSIGDYVDAVVEAASQIEGPVVLVGHSMGAFVVQRALQAVQVAGAVLLAAVPHTGVLGTTLRYAAAHPWAFLQINLRQSMHAAVATPRLAHATLFSREMPDDQVEHYHSRLQEDSWWAYVQMLGLALPRPARAHPCPVLVLAAEEDRLVRPAWLERTARAYAATFDTVPGVAHDVMLDPGWRSVAERMMVWLDGAFPDAPR